MKRYFRQKADLGDTRWGWIETSIPDGGMPEAVYVGEAALERLERFAQTFTHGFDQGRGRLALRDVVAEYAPDPLGHLTSGFRFQQKPRPGGTVDLQIRFPLPTAFGVHFRTPKEYEGDAAIRRLYGFLKNWKEGRDAERTPELVVAAIRKRYLDRLLDPTLLPNVYGRGWRFALSSIAGVTRFEAQLHPAGRSWSTEEDWRYLGAVVSTLGAPREPLRPIEETPPADPICWEWDMALVSVDPAS
jgi:hypothetical protein